MRDGRRSLTCGLLQSANSAGRLRQRQATKESIQRALSNKPTVNEVIASAKTAKHPFASDAEKTHGVGV